MPVEQLELAHRLRTLAAQIVAEPPHMTHGELVATLLTMRCIETHEAIELLVQNLMVRDAMVLLRSSVEYGVNAAYLMYCGDNQTVEDFVERSAYQQIKNLQTLKATSEVLLRFLVSAEAESIMQQQFETLRRFDKKPGDKWSVDDRLYKRAAKLDGAIAEYFKGRYQSDYPFRKLPMYPMFVNSLWPAASAFVHGTADMILSELSTDGQMVSFQQTSEDEAAKTLWAANYNLFLLLWAMDLRFSANNSVELLTLYNEILDSFNILPQPL